MKLATLTAYIWSGWPRGVVTAEQTHTGHIVGTYTTGKKKVMRNDPLPLCSDWSNVVITQDAYNAAVAESLRNDSTEKTRYFPLSQDPSELSAIMETEDFTRALKQHVINAAGNEAILVAEVIRLRHLLTDILSVHLTTVRGRRKAAAASVAAEKSLVWLLAQVLAKWPSVSFGGTTLYARCITQNKDGELHAHYEWEGNEHPWPIAEIPKEFTWLADDWFDGPSGSLRKVTRDQWETAVKARAAKSAARATLLEQSFKSQVDITSPVDTSSVEAMLEYGKRTHELARKALGLAEGVQEQPTPRSSPNFDRDSDFNQLEEDPHESLHGDDKYGD